VVPVVSRVVVSGARSLAALELVRAFGGAGHRVVAVDCPRWTPAGASGSAHAYRRVRSPRHDPAGFGVDVARILDEERPDLWIPTCEEVFHLAALRGRDLPNLPLAAPSLERLLDLHDKHAFARAAEGLGLAPARTDLLLSVDDVRATRRDAGDLVYKPVWSRFGTRALVRPDPGLLRLVRPTPDAPWVAQAYLPGEEASVYCVAGGGTVLAYAAYRSAYRAAGAGVHFAPALDRDLREATDRLVAGMSCDGQVAFDFRRDAGGDWKVLECNPRSTSGLHLLPHGDIVDAFAGIPAQARTRGTAMVGAAMLAFGLRGGEAGRGLRSWVADFRLARDVVGPNARVAFSSIGLVLETLARSAGSGMSLPMASTADIEWNGRDGAGG
jgi:hypothetical protein